MYRLLLFGGISLEGPDGPVSGPVGQRQRLGLLAVLAASRPGHVSRAKLVGLFWPERPEEKARHSLANSLYLIRKEMGEDAIQETGGGLRLNPDVVWCDVSAFRDALARSGAGSDPFGQPADLEEAVALYRGPLLDGFYVPDAPDFERWADAERRRLADRYGNALETLAEDAEARESWALAVDRWKRRAAHEPTNSRVVLRLMEALTAAGNRAGAVEQARAHEALLREELGVGLPSEVTAALEALETTTGGPVPPPTARGSPSTSREAEGEPTSEAVAAGPGRRSRAARGHGPRTVPAEENDRALADAPDSPVGVGRTAEGSSRRLLTGSAVVAAIVLGVALAVPRVFPPDAAPGRPVAEGVSGTTLVVLPFTVRGSDRLAYLSEGMVDLLSTALDDAGELRAVDPHALLGFLHRRGAVTDPDEAAEVARHFGAGIYLRGSLVAAGDRIRASAVLYNVEGSQVGQARATVDDERRLLEVVDALSRQLLATGIGGPETRLSKLAAVTTRSLPALREYLRGENAYRANRFDSATVAYRRAASGDSTFALAHYRLAVAGAYATADVDVEAAIGRALRHRDRLADRDRALLEAHDAFLRGAPREAERRLREIVGRYPSDVEAWYSLGRLLLWHVPVLVRSTSELRAVEERVLALDPENAKALYELSWVASMEGRHDEAVAHLERFLQLAGEGDQAAARRAGLAYALEDRAAEERSLAELRTAEDVVVLFAAEDVARAADHRIGAIEVAALLTEPTRSPTVRLAGHSLGAHLQLTMGQWEEAQTRLRRAGRIQADPLWSPLITRADLAATSFLPARPVDLGELRDRIARSDSGSARARVVRPYLAGLLSVRLGDEDAVERHVRRLTALSEDESAGARAERRAAMSRDLALSVRGHWQKKAGRPEEALALLDRSDPHRWWSATSWHASVGPSALGSRAHERYLRAELLRELGRDEEALTWYGTFGWRPSDEIYLTPAHLRQGEIHERSGNLGAAAHHYRRVVRLWRDCDPELRDWVDAARAGLARLTDDTGTKAASTP